MIKHLNKSFNVYDETFKPNPELSDVDELVSSSDCRDDGRRDLLIYLKQNVRLMEKTTMMALVVVMIAFIGIGFAVPAMPLITEASAQGNATGNQTGNWTDAGSGNVSGMVTAP